MCQCSSIVKKECINEALRSHLHLPELIVTELISNIGAVPAGAVSPAFLSSEGKHVLLVDPLEGLCYPLPSFHVFPSCMLAIQRTNAEGTVGPVVVSKKRTFTRCKLVLWFGLCRSPPPPPSLWLKRISFKSSGELSCPPAYLDQNFVFDFQQKLNRLINISKQIGCFYFPPLPPKSVTWSFSWSRSSSSY